MGSCTELIDAKDGLEAEIASAEHAGRENIEIEVDDANYILDVLNDIIRLKQENGL